MNTFYGFEFNLNDDELSDSIVVSDEKMNAIPKDRYSVGDIPMVVKCTSCNKYMRLEGKVDDNVDVGEFVCDCCGKRIPQRRVFEKIADEIEICIKAWDALPLD